MQNTSKSGGMHNEIWQEIKFLLITIFFFIIIFFLISGDC